MMDFVFCPRCEQLNQPESRRCTQCGADLTAVSEPAPPPPPARAVPPPTEPPPSPALPPQAQALEEAIKAKPTARALYLQLAQAYENAGQRDQARATLARYLALDPGNAWVRQRLEAMSRSGAARATEGPVPAVHAAMPAPMRLRALPPRPAWQKPVFLAAGLTALAAAGILAKVLVFPSTRLLVGGDSDAHAPRWSPKGSSIAFFSARGDKTVLSLYGLGDKKVRDLATLGHGGDFAWSPDGRRIAFVSTVEEEDLYGEAVFSVDVEGGTPMRLAMGHSPAWSPDGIFVAMTCSGEEAMARVRADYRAATTYDEEGMALAMPPPPLPAAATAGLCLVNAVTSEVTRLSADARGSVVFSPDGARIVFAMATEDALQASMATAAEGAPEFKPGEVDPMTESIIGQQPRNLAQASNVMSREVQARRYDEKKKQAAAGGMLYAEPGDLFTMAADGSGLDRLTRTGRCAAPVWSKDGGRLFYVSPADKGAEVWAMAAGGGSPQRLFSIPVEAWDPSAVAVSPDGKRVVFPARVPVADEGLARLMTGESPIDLHVMEAGDKAPRRLENKHLFKQRFALSPDGRKVVYEYKNKTGKSELWLLKL